VTLRFFALLHTFSRTMAVMTTIYFIQHPVKTIVSITFYLLPYSIYPTRGMENNWPRWFHTRSGGFFTRQQTHTHPSTSK